MSPRTFRKRVTTIFYNLKYGKPTASSPVIPVYQQNNTVIAILRVVTRTMLQKQSAISMLASWRRRSNRWFPSQFRVTAAGTKRWSRTQLLEKQDRILFLIEDLVGKPIGHLGLYRFDFKTYSCEVDNVIRGTGGIPGVMTASVRALCLWGKEVLGVRSYTLRVVSRNTKAVALYTRAGFVEVERIPLKKIITKGTITWEELPRSGETSARRFDLRMKLV
jgi:RimJ/RimL family protein N-acetyltransferase